MKTYIYVGHTDTCQEPHCKTVGEPMTAADKAVKSAWCSRIGKPYWSAQAGTSILCLSDDRESFVTFVSHVQVEES